ncbi:MAG: hypothetical protein QOE92_1278 [Chloroflexota bacterium]|jgi:hypothetical protein|nr:hypothetical protein [Chloroflexota bacterium]
MLTTTSRTNGAEIMRRLNLQMLDELLAELEMLNLREQWQLPENLSARLRAAGVGHRPDSNVTQVIDLVFRAQEAYLHRPDATARRSTAA